MGILRHLPKRRRGGPFFYALSEGSSTFSLVLHDQKPDDFHQLPCRLTVDEIPLDNGAIDALYEISRGNLRAIDVITLQTLQIAAMAKVTVADSTHVVEARKRVIP